jgi:hypothetical protein
MIFHEFIRMRDAGLPPPWWEEAEACPCAGRCPACEGQWNDEPTSFDAGL